MQILRIKKLPNALVNRIAAGEVVERPASALKEILENSIDAGATKITVMLQDGGIKQIKLIDNGVGIHEDDLVLALDRHATSKLSNEDMLYNITTLGFRGEGLASIASVSRFSLASKLQYSKYGYKIISNFGNVGDVEPVAINDGTVVEVNELYHNIPARKKFLKSVNTEYGHSKSVFERIALSHPQIAFELYHNDKLIYQLPVAPILQRILELFGDAYLKFPIEILETQINGLSLSGYIYHPSYLSGHKNVQFFYLNGRYVRDRVIQNAIKQAYSGALHQEHQPQYVLFLEMNPQEVDVNVHPTKSEVRFQEVGSIHNFISSTIRKALAITPTDKSQITPALDSLDFVSPKTKISENLCQQEQSNLVASKYDYGKSDLGNKNIGANYSYGASTSSKLVKNWLPLDRGSNNSITASKEPNLFEPANSGGEPQPILGHALALLNGVYILSQVSEGLIVVDMHAAHERIILERLKVQLAQNKLAIQNLLVPIMVDIDTISAATFKEHSNTLNALGIQCNLLGEERLEICSAPLLLDNVDIATLVLDILGELANYGNSNALKQHSEEILSSIACHSAVRANHSLGIAQMNAILRDMEQTTMADYCNHGRPTWVKISMQELDAMFMRGK